MPAAIRYIGALERYFEIGITGQQQGWYRGQTSTVSDSDAAALVASGLFEYVTSSAQTISVTITGTLTVGSVLTAAITAGYGGTLTYQWVRGADGASDLTGASNISGATSSTYTLVSGDMGRLIGCLVSGLTYQGRTSGVIAGVAPSVTTAPAIVGTPEVGAAASYTTGTYSGTTPITKAVQWLLDGAVIVGETGATYTPIEADEGKSLAIRETASNAWGSVASTSSGATIAAAGAAPTALPSGYVAKWSADSITGVANGAAVNTWTDEVNSVTADKPASKNAPTYVA